MLPDPVRRIVEEIGSDTRSGAMPLAQRALDAYSLLSELSGGQATAEELHRHLEHVQPWMAAVINASVMGGEIAASGRWEDLGRLRDRLATARQEVAHAAMKPLKGCRTLLTISYSTDVFEALRRLQRETPGLKVYVCESRPLREGVALAQSLGKVSVNAELVADAAGPSIVPRCDAVVTGADSLLRDGQLVNKIGTLGLGLACVEFGVPFYALMEVLKVELVDHQISWEEESRDPGELSTEVKALNFYFERVPVRLVHSLVTDAGVMDTSSIMNRFKRAEDLIDFYVPGGPKPQP